MSGLCAPSPLPIGETMTNLVPLIVLAAAQSTQPAPIPTFFTGGELLEVCERPADGRPLCMMYVAGVLDGLFYARREAGGTGLCPSPLTNRDAAELVKSYLERHPSVRPLAAARVVRLATAERLACDEDED